jgi:hypothetical protein
MKSFCGSQFQAESNGGIFVTRLLFVPETATLRGGSRGRQISRATEVKIAYLKKFDSSYL